MRNTIFALFLVCLPASLFAQQLTVSEPGSKDICVGETMSFTLSATGNFSSNNTFILQSSSDGFKTFSNIGELRSDGSTLLNFDQALTNVRFRAVSSDPYVEGTPTANTMSVWARPGTPPLYLSPFKAVVDQQFKAYGIKDLLTQEYEWHIQDGAISDSSKQAAITFTSAGTKRIQVIATNNAGCADTALNEVVVYPCEAKLPAKVHVVTGDETGEYQNVWIKSGGKYSTGNSGAYDVTIFMETGSSLRTEGQPAVYAKPGASIQSAGGGGYPLVLQDGSVSVDPHDRAVIYTCPDMQFDYSQVTSSVAEEELKADLKLSMDRGRLVLRVEGRFNAKLIDATGRTMIESSEMRDSGTLDLHALSSGAYFVLVTKGQTTIARQVQR